MKIEKVDILCIAIAIFFALAYWKLQNIVFLLVALVLVVPVVFFQLKTKKSVPQNSP